MWGPALPSVVMGSRCDTGKIPRLLYLPAVTFHFMVLYLGTYYGFYSHFISNFFL